MLLNIFISKFQQNKTIINFNKNDLKVKIKYKTINSTFI